jgi:hypothetical protein
MNSSTFRCDTKIDTKIFDLSTYFRLLVIKEEVTIEEYRQVEKMIQQGFNH